MEGKNMDNKMTLPLIPLRGLTIFPNMVLHFDVGREKSIAALEEAMLNNAEIFLSNHNYSYYQALNNLLSNPDYKFFQA